jgi:hypothetical protein
MNKKHKIFGQQISIEFLNQRAKFQSENGYPVAKWIQFCKRLIEEGYTIKLREARQTVSKYVYVSHAQKQQKSFLVRFSNHKPIQVREAKQDCDFFVGVTNFGVTTTDDAYRAVQKHFEIS